MLRRSGISVLKSVFRHSFQSCAKPTSPLLIKNSLSKLPTHQLGSNSVAVSLFQQQKWLFSTESDYSREVDEINLKFAEAREEIETAMDAKETVYFNEDAECAKAAVKEVLDMFEGLLEKLNQNQKDALQRSMGLKIEQLKAELQQLDHD